LAGFVSLRKTSLPRIYFPQRTLRKTGMNFENPAHLDEKEFAYLKNELADIQTLGQVLTWAGTEEKGNFLPAIVAETITQDEYTHDIIIPFRDLFLVFDTT
jgi:hypothetical protein